MVFEVRRRDLLGGLFVTSLAFSLDLKALCAHAEGIASGKSPYFFLTKDEATILTALCDRIIPKDEYPSASEAGVIDYIDFELATSWGQGHQFYMEGPFDPHAPKNFGYQQAEPPAGFVRKALAALMGNDAAAWQQKSPQDLDHTISALEDGKLNPGGLSGQWFFIVLRDLTSQGYFADPVYNGNRDYVGWRMIGFPGADAYYTTEVDRYNMVYNRAPRGVAHRPGVGTVPFTAQSLQSSAEQTVSVGG